MTSADGADGVPLYGLVLSGGRSTRMRVDKALIDYHGEAQLIRTFDLVAGICEATWVSVREDQRDEPVRARFPQIVDLAGVEGPASGIRAAQRHAPAAAWLVVACDLPFLDRRTLAHLVTNRDLSADATAFVSTFDGLPEPLCAVWEPSSAAALEAMLETGRSCPRKALMNMRTTLLEQLDERSLDNANTPEDRDRVLRQTACASPAEGGPGARTSGRGGMGQRSGEHAGPGERAGPGAGSPEHS